jgi:hypothetical protein
MSASAKAVDRREVPRLPVIAITEQMLEAAMSGDWERLVELQSEREPFLVSERQTDAAAGELGISGIQHVLDINRRITELVADERTRVGSELKRSRAGRKAVRAFQASETRGH